MPRSTGSDVTLICEPGRVIVGNAGVLLTRVLYLKQGEIKNFVDRRRGDERPHPAGVLRLLPRDLAGREAAARERDVADVVGPICETGDFLARDRELAQRRPRRPARVMSAGAYGFTMASNYNSRPRAAEVMVKGGEQRPWPRARDDRRAGEERSRCPRSSADGSSGTDHHTPGMRRFERWRYRSYSSPKVASIIRSSRPTRSANMIAHTKRSRPGLRPNWERAAPARRRSGTSTNTSGDERGRRRRRSRARAARGFAASATSCGRGRGASGETATGRRRRRRARRGTPERAADDRRTPAATKRSRRPAG